MGTCVAMDGVLFLFVTFGGRNGLDYNKYISTTVPVTMVTMNLFS